MAISRNHSATHLLHSALKAELGDHVAQAGSLVTADRLRFDFSHFEAMTSEQLANVEASVNKAILDALDITVQELPIDEAKKLGAEAQFGEKYGAVVRVVSMGDYSMEFCGGTHLKNTAQAGLFKLISEGGVAAGVRRIEAVTGQGVLDYIKAKDEMIARTGAALKTNRLDELDAKAAAVMDENRDYAKKVEAFEAKMAELKTKNMLTSVRHIGEINLLTAQLDGTSVPELKSIADQAKTKVEKCVAVLVANTDGKITFVAMASKDAVKAGVHCGNIIKELTAICGGKGGGKPDMAQGGGKDALKIDDALAKVDELVINMTK
jgi:alanyl-tRNA synthetase